MSLNKKIINATKWSIISEVVAKLIVPITNIILARILAPEAFGVIATITMIISFTDMFTDAGFQKYLVQKQFKNDEEQNIAINVAFWTNLCLSIVLWIFIIFFSEKIAKLIGNINLVSAISIACIQLPLTSFSSIQMAIYRKKFEFKTLFIVRVIGVLIPLFITVPLAILEFDYWSLIIGNIIGQIFNAIILTLKSEWKPQLMYDFSVLKKMLSFSIWSLVEAISIWLTVWIDSFIIGNFLNEYYLGLYKTSISMVNSIMAIVTASIIPVLFSSLSKLQNNDYEFKKFYYNVQKYVAYLVFPIAIGGYVYRDFITDILLGRKWNEATNIIGIWIVTSAIVIVFSNLNSEVYRAKGKPKLSFISQLLHLVFLVPTCIISLNYGFWQFVYARSLIRLQGVLVGFIIIKYIMNFSIKKIIITNIKPITCSLIMGVIAIILREVSNLIIWNIISIMICVIVYLIIVWIIGFKDFKNIIKVLKKESI